MAVLTHDHLLGIAYPLTQTVDNTRIALVDDGAIVELKPGLMKITTPFEN